MRRAARTRLFRVSKGLALAVVASLAWSGGCGARTSLEARGSAATGAGSAGGDDPGTGTVNVGTGGASAGTGGAASEGCPRADAPASLGLPGRTMTWGGNIASNGCSFAATWLELRDGALLVAATTFQVVDGAWRAAPIAELGPAGASNNSPDIAWDGAAYVIAWADEVLHLQRLDEGAAPVGDVVTSFAAPGNVYVRWLQPGDDGSLRVGFAGYGAGAGYDVYVAHVAADGGVLAPPAALTSSGEADVAGFLAGPGAATAFWTTRNTDGVALLRARFDDVGALIEDPVTMITGDNVLVSRHGTALAGDQPYVGVLRVSPPEVLLARVGPEGHVLVEGVAGGDVPVLAATGRGVLGLLAREDRFAPTSALALSIIESGVVTSTRTLEVDPDSYRYVMAGSDDTLGVFTGTSFGDVTFTTWAP